MYQIKDHYIYLISENSTLTTTLIIFIENIFHYQSHALILIVHFLSSHNIMKLYASSNEQLLKPPHLTPDQLDL